MTADPPPPPPPQTSALQDYLVTHTTASSPHPAHLQHLSLQICHNLRHQHQWTALTIHHYAPTTTTAPDQGQAGGKRKRTPLSRPLISGLPPQRLYVHPDEQIALLQAAKAKASASELGLVGVAAAITPAAEREWVLPTHLNEKWSLQRFGQLFDRIETVPPDVGLDSDVEDEVMVGGVRGQEGMGNLWRTKKRVLLATLHDDSTVMYYIVHDGIVKPRQN